MISALPKMSCPTADRNPLPKSARCERMYLSRTQVQAAYEQHYASQSERGSLPNVLLGTRSDPTATVCGGATKALHDARV